ncbi:shikimate kinase [Galbibacter pacificus]|uniref:Shikimate kinase n=1 Tax=Galbibacter pacificus TaxID=2996052 RepID=A0ABT6FVE0_9FLAO|nr:shikimate kinase [Galbibacter pacificus]MDG3583846.1 shikimate kinase [Galbibacter pacificus]MDG3587236.1 shikimate kinase [Galbibacter pacificus]
MTIVLLGYMGSGKSTVGKILAKKQSLEFIDFDDYIVENEKLSIPEIFKQKGEIYFRKIEGNYLKQLLQDNKDAVISLGGGTPCFGNNMEYILKATPNVFYLKLTAEKLVERLLPEKEQRPLVKDIPNAEMLEFIRKHLFERNFFYLKSPNIISVNDELPEEIAVLVQEKLA